MPPQGRGRGGGAGGGAGRAGSAASADPGAGPSTSGRSGPASQLSLLPAPLLRAYRALPAAAEALLQAPVTQRPGGGGSAAGRGRGAGSGRLVALREGKEQLSSLRTQLRRLPEVSPPPKALALAELLSTHPAETAALLRLYSAALRPDGEGGGGGGSGSGVGSGGGGGPADAPALEGWRADAATSAQTLIRCSAPASRSRPLLSAVLRFVLALLRAQTLPALSRRLAAAATNAAAGSSGGAGKAILQHSVLLIDNLYQATLSYGLLSDDALPADVLSLRVICVEELARGLAESGLLEHTARALLLLQARGPQRLLCGASDSCPDRLLHTIAALCRDLSTASLFHSIENIAKLTDHNDTFPAPIITPAAAAHLRSVLRGRCLQTAVLVYGVGTLRLLDGGPSYGLPAALQTAGLALRNAQEEGSLSAVALDLLVSSVLPWRLGPEASLELALRAGWVAAASAATASPPNLPPVTAGVGAPPPLLNRLSLEPCGAAALLVDALTRGRSLLTLSPGLAERRGGWWRLVASVAVYGMEDDERLRHRHWQLWKLATEPIADLWPDGRLDLDALPPDAPPEVAAALAAGLLPALTALPDLPLPGPPAKPRGPFDELLTACDLVRPDGSGLALFLAPLLAYGEPGQAEGLLGALGRAGGLVGPSGGGAGTEPSRAAATSLLGALAGALQRCRRLGPAAAEAPAGPVEAAEGAGADESSEAEAGAKASGGPCGAASRALKPPPAPPVQQLRRLVEYASELWGLPLPAQPAAVGSMGGEAN
ncbi:hypothetical protein HYH03_003817 [Edaphochlamys debaryana]|uniref:Uncharacterized protein n=1 Tax=Edaphochlamys debaryana TaxID=47281 RepID=A0A836C2J0_9CHLO|nr:hypothetical protein HYH03_003817 [Edaphochlamys debaryana]|eukprot:KAG2498056.1 hypothetical protein HYH03_003817 [Edaphochlamys debaryana]